MTREEAERAVDRSLALIGVKLDAWQRDLFVRVLISEFDGPLIRGR